MQINGPGILQFSREFKRENQKFCYTGVIYIINFDFREFKDFGLKATVNVTPMT